MTRYSVKKFSVSLALLIRIRFVNFPTTTGACQLVTNQLQIALNGADIILWLKFAYLSGGYNTSDDYEIIFDK